MADGIVNEWIAPAFAALAAIAASVTASVNYLQARRMRATLRAQLSLDLEKAFFRDTTMIKNRKAVAEAVKTSSNNDPAMREVVAFLDTVGILVRLKLINDSLAFHNFGRFAVFYQACCESYIARKREHATEAWNDLDYLIERMNRYMARKQHAKPTKGTRLYIQMLDDESSLQSA